MTSVTSLVGMALLLCIAIAFSENRKAIRFRTVGWAFALQFALGAFVLFVPWGKAVLEAATNAVSAVIGYGNEGIEFIFGPLVSDKMFEVFGDSGFVFAFRVLPVVIFFSALISLLYYLGAMQWIIHVIGGALRKLLGTSETESLSATANIFVSQTEAPLVVRPYLSRMTRSELFAVMAGGMASVAGSVLAGYAGLGADLSYLIAASFMAAPGGLLFAKLLVPETETPHEELVEQVPEQDQPANVFDAAATGAANGLKLAVNIGAMLLAFIGLIALINGLFAGVGGWFGFEGLTLQKVLGYAFAPLAWVIGVPTDEIAAVGSLIGQKLVLNEFVGFVSFAEIKDSLSPVSQAIATFALCGFANFGSIAVLLGGLGVLAPDRRQEIARLGLKAVLAGSLSNLMSAAIAGFFIGIG